MTRQGVGIYSGIKSWQQEPQKTASILIARSFGASASIEKHSLRQINQNLVETNFTSQILLEQ